MTESTSRKRLPGLLRWFIGFVMVLALIVLGIYWYIGWSGEKAAERAIEAYIAEGGTLDHQELAATPIPDEGNYAAIPSLRGITIPDDVMHESGIDGKAVRARLIQAYEFFEEAKTDHPIPKAGSQHTSGPPADLQGWSRKFNKTPDEEPIEELTRAEAAESILRKIDANLKFFLDESDEAASAANSQFTPTPGTFFDTELPFNTPIAYGSATIELSSILSLRAKSAACLERGEVSANSILGILQLAKADSYAEIGLIQFLIAITKKRLAYSALAECLDQRCLNDAQLKQIQQQLGEVDILASFEIAMRVETVATVKGLEAMKDGSAGDEGFFFTKWYYPNGWIDLNRAIAIRKHSEIINPAEARDFQLLRIRMKEVVGWMNENQYSGFINRIKLAPVQFLLPLYSKVLVSAYSYQALNAQAQIACALERYFIAKGSYPKSLDELVPEFLERVPIDPGDGQPMRYRPTEDGRYMIYSVGWNETDENGVPSWDTMGAALNTEEGDWVWSYQDLSPKQSSD